MDEASSARPHVLVVEDEFLVALDLCAVIADAGCAVVGPVPTVDQALALLSRIELVGAFLDENLRGASVAPLARRLAERAIPFVVVSGYARSISPDPLLRAAPRIGKPASPRDVCDALSGFVPVEPR